MWQRQTKRWLKVELAKCVPYLTVKGKTWLQTQLQKPRVLYLELFDRSEIWQGPRQYYCQYACQIWKRCNGSNYQSHGRPRDFARSYDKTSNRLLRRAPERCLHFHYGDVILSAMASQITSLRDDCLLNRLFRRRSKKTSKPRVTGLCEGNSPVTGESPSQRASNAEMFPLDDVIMLN